MKRAIGAIIAAVALLAACASGPEPVPAPDEAYETAKTLRSQIQEFELAQYAQSEFDSAETQFAAAEVAYNTEEFAAADEGFNLAIDSYTEVIRAGFRAIAGARQEEAETQRARADEVKASVALANEYADALDVYNQAVAEAEAGNDQEAAVLFESAAGLFAQVFEDASDKRQQALEAMGRVDERIENLDVQRETLEQSAREDEEANQ